MATARSTVTPTRFPPPQLAAARKTWRGSTAGGGRISRGKRRAVEVSAAVYKTTIGSSSTSPTRAACCRSMRCCPGTTRAFAAAARRDASTAPIIRCASTGPGCRLRHRYARRNRAVHGCTGGRQRGRSPAPCPPAARWRPASARPSLAWRAVRNVALQSRTGRSQADLIAPPSGARPTHARCCMSYRCVERAEAAREEGGQGIVFDAGTHA